MYQCRYDHGFGGRVLYDRVLQPEGNVEAEKIQLVYPRGV
jgi:hypothetical protein